MQVTCPKLKQQLHQLPSQPGVYLFKAADNSTLYIGKAKILKNRVRSYFTNAAGHAARIEDMLSKVKTLEWLITLNETDALLLENKLIKFHKPKYNVRLKDHKTYPYLKLTRKELFPQLSFTRKVTADGAWYFGPYASAMDARALLRVILKHFPLRKKKLKLDGSKIYKPCINYQIGLCLAPCANKVSAATYLQLVVKVRQLLAGNYQELLIKLKTALAKYSTNLEFEQSNKVKNQVLVVKQLLDQQKVVSTEKIDQDVFCIIRQQGFAAVQALFVRAGVLLSSDFIFFAKGEQYQDADLLRSVCTKLYLEAHPVYPKEVLLPVEWEGAGFLNQYLQQKRKVRLKFCVPQRGAKYKLIQMAYKNGLEHLATRLQNQAVDAMVLQTTQAKLGLKKLPNLVECFDISNTAGTNAVGAMVSCYQNRMQKQQYRRYKIQPQHAGDDIKSMVEVLTRRYKRVLDQGLDFPDLILIDGGQGQLNCAKQVLKTLNAPECDLLAIAKGRSFKNSQHLTQEMDIEYVLKPGKPPILLKKNSAALHFLQRIRNEVHRFAVTFHRQQRAKRVQSSWLERVPNIGAQKRKALLLHFKSLQKIRTASIRELNAVPSISTQDAENLHQFLRSETAQ